MITALCGGVGGSKLTEGLYRQVPPEELTVIVNTADDLNIAGLHISPDLDTVMYTLAGMAGKLGWGIHDDSFAALEMFRRYGLPDWFQIGDRDLATDVVRTDALRAGRSLADVTRQMTRALGVTAHVLPMSNERVSTQLLVRDEWIGFQEYFVHRGHRDLVAEIRYEGALEASPPPNALQALTTSEVIVVVNSNPLLSIVPILSVPGIREGIQQSQAAKVAVSPLIGSDAVSGPAAKLMALAGQPSTATGVATLYRDIINGMVIDNRDAVQRTAIEAMGVRVLCTDTIMDGNESRERLARETLDFARLLA